MNQIPLPNPDVQQQMSSVGEGSASRNLSQPSVEEATAPSTLASQVNSRTPIGKSKTPSCNVCRRRKIKCDRADPCSNCVRCGSVCVSSVPSGAPRGRQGGRRRVDRELLDRMAKLEHLVKDNEGRNHGGTPAIQATVRHDLSFTWVVSR